MGTEEWPISLKSDTIKLLSREPLTGRNHQERKKERTRRFSIVLLGLLLPQLTAHHNTRMPLQIIIIPRRRKRKSVSQIITQIQKQSDSDDEQSKELNFFHS